MSLHTEINFETEICEHLAANGWLYSSCDDGYDGERRPKSRSIDNIHRGTAAATGKIDACELAETATP